LDGITVQLMGATQVEESTVTLTPTLAGMPASPHQIAVLKPRANTLKIAQASADPNLVTVGPDTRLAENHYSGVVCFRVIFGMVTHAVCWGWRGSWAVRAMPVN